MEILGAIVDWFKGFWDLIISFFEWISDAYDDFIKFIKEFPEWLFGKFADGVVAYYEAIPVPDFFATAQQAFANIPSEVIFFAEAFQIGTGVSMIFSAYLLRFVTRRIPLIG